MTTARTTSVGYGIYTVTLLGLGVGYVIGHFLPSLSHTLDRQIAADNFVTVTLYVFCLALYATYWKEISDGHGMGRRVRQWGQVVTFGSWALHRLYWGVWRYFRDNGDVAFADWMRDYLAWITSVMQLGVWVGASLIIMPFFAVRFGPQSWWLPGVLVPTLWISYFMLFSWI